MAQAFPVSLEIVPGPAELGSVELRAVSLEVDPEGLAACRRRLSLEEQRRADRFHFERDRRRFTVARAALRTQLAERLGEGDLLGIEIEVDEFGKPRLASKYGSDFHFNLAHSGERAVFAFSNYREVGIDLEDLEHVSRVADLAKAIGCDEERRWLESQSEAERPLALLRMWTAKEAFLKAIGTGLHIEPNRLSVPSTVLLGGREPTVVRWLDAEARSAEFTLYPLPGCEESLACSAALSIR